MRSLALALLTLPLALPGFAADGVLEINQACAESPTGCFAGDMMGFPVTIAIGGSYRLTGNLEVASTSVDGIEVVADKVTLDLVGFTVSGPAGPGTGRGIFAGSDFVAIANGFVQGFGGGGIVSVATHLTVLDVHSSDNGADGLRAGPFSEVRGGSFRGNTSEGIELGANSKVVGVRVSASNFGIVVAGGSLVRDCVAEGNTNHGIRVTGPGSRVESCVATSNNIGISIDADGCTVVKNTTTDNTSEGIASGILGSTSYSHGLFDGNHMANNGSRGILITGTNNTIVRNVSQGNTTNYVILADNQVGTVVSGVDTVGVAGSSGGNLDATVGAWANFAR